MSRSRVLQIRIARNAADVYAYCADPANLPRWASGLGEGIRHADGVWRADTAQGAVTIRFSPPNEYGVLDHWVRFESGAEVYVPMRVIAHDDGCELQFTLFRQPDMSDAQYDADAEWVMRDLRTLKALLET